VQFTPNQPKYKALKKAAQNCQASLVKYDKGCLR